MISTYVRLFSGVIAATFALWGACLMAVHAQPSPESPSAEAAQATAGSVTQPQGESYVAPQKLSPKLARVTFYRPRQGFTSGVAHLEVNGHYHTSLQLGGYTEVCLEPAEFQLAAHMVETGAELKNVQDATATLQPQAAQNLYVRVYEHGDGLATLSPVKVDFAQIELKDTRRQMHTASRLAEAKECVEPELRVVKQENIVLGADALFAFGKADLQGISAQGRDALDQVIERLQKEYGNDENTVIQITGHADPLGNPAANKRLSEARAQAIRSYMIQGGMSPERITGEGVGDTQPVVATCGKTVTPESIECNKLNRRVVVNVQVTAR
jgi:OOP family OmpA-OmpF porin